MERYCTVTVTDENIRDFIEIQNKYPKAFYQEATEIPALIAVRHATATGNYVKITYKNVKGTTFDVHYEVEGSVLRYYPGTDTTVYDDIGLLRNGVTKDISMTIPLTFDMRVRYDRNLKEKFVLITPPKDKRAETWLKLRATNRYVPCSKGYATNFIYIMSMHFMVTRLAGYLPYTLLYKPLPNGKTDARPVSNFKEVAIAGIERHIQEEREKHRFDGWDVVRLNWEQYDKISNLVEETGKIDNLGTLPLSKFAVLIQTPGETGLIAKYDVYPRHGEVTCMLELTNSPQDCSCYFEVKRIENPLTGEASLKYTMYEDDSKELPTDSPLLAPCGENMNTADVIFEIFINVCSFMLNYKDETMDVEERVCKNQSTGTHSKKHSRNSVRLFKSYTLKKGWKTKANRKKAEIHCLAWGVRGHFRHYRNGKVIFINSYIKGKEREKYAGKDYLLMPDAQ